MCPFWPSIPLRGHIKMILNIISQPLTWCLPTPSLGSRPPLWEPRRSLYLHINVLTDEYDSFRVVEIVPKDEPEGMRFTTPFLIYLHTAVDLFNSCVSQII
ncbi:hypothetical protein ILYODFUR_016494 [Ilyodon furcidens]|uniref:Uncharacterized protein n=1 Tax=Ilyodon furcidens TaxID=33524 RepID=A0ABV0SLP0_9TELE